MNKITSTENVRLDFVYDASATLIGVNTIEGHYFYIRDITGNILGLIDNEGNYIVKYKYDAWGKVLEKKICESCIASRHNPFVYKGYFLDEETGFYYLKSRYYDPVIRRFISIDSPQYIDQEDLSGLNLYAYCGNNPVKMVDPSGHFGILAMLLIGTVIGATTGFGFNVGKQLVTNNWNFNDVDWGSAVNSAIVGGALGFSLAMGVGVLGPAIAGTAATTSLSVSGAFAISSAVSFAGGALGYSTQEWIDGRTPDFGKSIMHGVFVMLEGIVNFGVGGIIGSVGNIGTKGKPFLRSLEWWGKFIFGQEFTQPFKIGIDLLRNNL